MSKKFKKIFFKNGDDSDKKNKPKNQDDSLYNISSNEKLLYRVNSIDKVVYLQVIKALKFRKLKSKIKLMLYYYLNCSFLCETIWK